MCPLSPTASTRTEPSGCTWITVRLACGHGHSEPRTRIDLQRLDHEIANDVAVRDQDVVAPGALRGREELGERLVQLLRARGPLAQQLRLQLFRMTGGVHSLSSGDCATGTFDSVSCITAAVSRARCSVLDVMESNETPLPLKPRSDQARLSNAERRNARTELRIRVAIGDVRAVANQVERSRRSSAATARPSRSR